MRHPTPNGPHAPNGTSLHHDTGPSAALMDKVRALDSLPRLGALRTLDLKGNDLRVRAAVVKSTFFVSNYLLSFRMVSPTSRKC